MRGAGGSVLARRGFEVVRGVLAAEVSGIPKEGVLPDVNPREPAATGERNWRSWAGPKGIELAKLARRDRQDFDCATWLHKAGELSKEDFQQAVERELTGKIAEPWEIVYFKLYESQVPVIDHAIETAALMLGSDRSRGYCLEMICADFLAGANMDNENPETLLFSMTRFFRSLPEEYKQTFLDNLSEKAS